jgi:hypothetical protein
MRLFGYRKKKKRTVACPILGDLERVATATRQSGGEMKEDREAKGALRLFSAACLAIIAGGTGRDAELLRIAHRH